MIAEHSTITVTVRDVPVIIEHRENETVAMADVNGSRRIIGRGPTRRRAEVELVKKLDGVLRDCFW